MEIPEMLDILKQRALADNRLREEFLATRKEEPVSYTHLQPTRRS